MRYILLICAILFLKVDTYSQKIQTSFYKYEDDIKIKKEEGTIVNDKKNGEWLYYENSIANPVLGKRIYKDNDLISSEKYVNGKPAEKTSTVENTNIKYNQFNSNGKPDGQWRNTHSGTSFLKEKGNYINGEKDGEWLYYNYPNGDGSTNFNLKENYKNGILDGIVTEYYYSGAVLRIKNYKNGCEDGEQIKYYDAYQGHGIYSKENYSKCNGFRYNGKQIYYYVSGTIEHTTNYVNGKKDGEWFTNDKYGKMISKTIYKDDQIIGHWDF